MDDLSRRLASTRGDVLSSTIEPLVRRVDEVQGRGLWEGGRGEEGTVREVGRVWEVMEILVEVSAFLFGSNSGTWRRYVIMDRPTFRMNLVGQNDT